MTSLEFFLSFGLLLIIHGRLELNVNKLVTEKYLNNTYLFCMKYRLQSRLLHNWELYDYIQDFNVYSVG